MIVFIFPTNTRVQVNLITGLKSKQTLKDVWLHTLYYIYTHMEIALKVINILRWKFKKIPSTSQTKILHHLKRLCTYLVVSSKVIIVEYSLITLSMENSNQLIDI